MAEPSNSLPFEHLSVAERILFVEQIWDSIAADQEALEITAAQRAELDRRLKDLEASPDEGMSWEEVKARLHRERDKKQ